MSQEGTGVGVRGAKASSGEGASHLLSDLEAGDMDKDHNTGYRTEAHVETGSNGVCTFLLTAISIFFIIVTFPLSLLMCIKILTKDSVTVAVDAVVYYRIQNATVAVTNVEDYGRSTRLLAATTLRNVLGTKSLSEILSEREAISHTMQVIAAEGEQRAARSLKEAADVISESGPALQLRYLQTLTSIAAEKNSTIVFPLPMELFKGVLGKG
ncbi:hypothetical protein V5799_017900 [Amblyomma americanum]|uniref:Band 7 domain-containing protein n=1 Tax=Amblyomma americanum TaxID=6943 RepID=A0AAQ4F1B0_AMBAM